MKTIYRTVLFTLFILISASVLLSQDIPSIWLEGYTSDVSGEVFTYHSPHPEATTSLLLRNLDSTRYIEWIINPVPQNSAEEMVTYVWMFGIDVNVKKFDYKLYLDGRYLLTFTNPQDTLTKTWTINGKENSCLTFRSTLVDKYGDLMGYAFLKLPTSLLRTSQQPKLRVMGETAGDRSWYMTFRYRLQSKISVKQEPALVKGTNGPEYLLRFDIHHFGNQAHAIIKAGTKEVSKDIILGLNLVYLSIPTDIRNIEATVIVNGDTVSDQCVLPESVRHIDLYLLHHTHTDIGYTHVQTEVEQLHHKYLQEAIELAKQTQDNPEEARFKWNTEVMWAVDSYLAEADSDQRKAFLDAVNKGWIELDGLYANELTGLCNQEELIHLTEAGRRISAQCKVPLQAAMISDIPGYTWALVSAMAQSGIRYFSIGPNTGHRIGSFLETWADKPFYWISQDGKDTVLCWVAGKGYSWFHTGLGFIHLKNKLNEKSIFEYVSQLKNSGFPYDMTAFRYNIGSDNGPPDPYLADAVKNWNEKYESPRIIISTVSESFRIFEEKYGSQLPVYKGDWTPYWEDGAASSALETAQNRQATERLVQAEALWAIIDPGHFPIEKFYDAWRNVLLFDEHTWGSWNSISEPENPFTLKQWAIKKNFATITDSLSKLLLNEICLEKGIENLAEKVFDVYNTCSWARSDIIFLTNKQYKDGEIIKDDKGETVASQLMSTGELAVLVKNIPPLGSRRFFIHKGKSIPVKMADSNLPELLSDRLRIQVSPENGDIRSLSWENNSLNLVDMTYGYGLNHYLYVAGRKPDRPTGINNVSIRYKENGALLKSLVIESEAPGCNKITSEIRIYNDFDKADIINALDKKMVYEPEGVYLGFPFNIPEGEIRMGLATGNYIPGKNQLPGSCKNYFTAGKWVDVSNGTSGITMISPDAPLFELGGITTDATATGWIRESKPTQTLLSYVMNNYWETNYLAAQGGIATMRYSLIPHEQFNAVRNEKWARELTQPLLVVTANPKLPVRDNLFLPDNDNVLVSAIKPCNDKKGIIIRLYNPSDELQDVEIKWNGLKPVNIYKSNFDDEKIELTGSKFMLMPFEIISLRVE
jgi:hypothetical protein